MLTKVSTPTASAASSTLRVPSTLVLNASDGVPLEHGEVLERGRVEDDLRAAALERGAAARRRRGCRRAAGRRCRAAARPSMDSWVACRPLSSRSSMSRCDGPNLLIWRHSSDPIEPPAPVTSTRLPPIWSAMAAMSRCDRLTAEQVGDVEVAQVGGRGAAAEQLAHRRKHQHVEAAVAGQGRQLAHGLGGGAGHRDDERGGLVLRGDAGEVVRGCRAPGRPEKCSRALCGSSSSRATGTMPLDGSRTRLCTRMRPPEPAPKMTARLVLVDVHGLVGAARADEEPCREHAQSRRGRGRSAGTLRGRSMTPSTRVRVARTTPATAAARATSLVSSNEPELVADGVRAEQPAEGDVHDDHDRGAEHEGRRVRVA